MAYVSFFFGVYPPSPTSHSLIDWIFFHVPREEAIFAEIFFSHLLLPYCFFFFFCSRSSSFFFSLSFLVHSARVDWVWLSFFCRAHLLCVCVCASFYSLYSVRIAKCGFYNRFVPLYFILLLAFIVQRFNRLTEINTSFKWGSNWDGWAGGRTKSASSLCFRCCCFSFSILPFANMLIGLQFVQ